MFSTSRKTHLYPLSALQPALSRSSFDSVKYVLVLRKISPVHASDTRSGAFRLDRFRSMELTSCGHPISLSSDRGHVRIYGACLLPGGHALCVEHEWRIRCGRCSGGLVPTSRVADGTPCCQKTSAAINELRRQWEVCPRS